MTVRTRFGIFLALAALTLGVFFYRYQRTLRAQRRSIFVMGTVGGSTFYASGKTARTAEKAIDAEFAAVTAVADPYCAESELSRLNRSAFAAPFRCGTIMWEILSEARRAYRLTDGAFDISVRPLMELWGFYRKAGKRPTAAEIAAAKAKVGLDKVVFDDLRHTVRFTVPGMALDLGGIAKGYALDRAGRAAQAAGVESGVIDLGGNLRLLPNPPPRQEFYRIGIRFPGKAGTVIPKALELPGDVAVSTSGDYERFVVLEGKRFGHIIDPVTGIPAAVDCSVTAVLPKAVRADWISTAVYLRGKALAGRLERIFPGLHVIMVPRRK